ncbi:MAG: DNA/RNA helicase domain-containing protein [Aeromicrobium sp.]
MVYTLDGDQRVYVGESIHAVTRMQQHLQRRERDHLEVARVIVDPTFNKSACLDLESFLIALFAGDGKFQVDNANAGLTGSNYYDRDAYRGRFREIFDRLRAEGMFDGTITQIENGDLFKLSPFKTLNYEQRVIVVRIVEAFLTDLRGDRSTTSVIQGQPGTGKTIVGIYLMKLLSDIRGAVPLEDSDSDDVFSGFFTEENAALLADTRMGLVVPQQSLRETVKKVFKRTSGLHQGMVLSPTQVGGRADEYDLLLVDETHRLQQLSATMAIKRFREINRKLFDGDEAGGHQLDWIRRKSRHRILLLDPEQSIRPASDLPSAVLRGLEAEASTAGRLFPLTTQMRVRAGEDYVAYVRDILSEDPPDPALFSQYEFRLFDDLSDMRAAIADREDEIGLSRLIAGYAWEWRSKSNPHLFDIEIGDLQLRWNVSDTDWISSPTSVDEVGSIHTTQGYDLNYAGVIIGPDLRYDPSAKLLHIDRSSYFDKAGKRSNKMLGLDVTDEMLQTYIINIYRVLLTRGIRGTYVYVCDDDLRDYLAEFIAHAEPPIGASRSMLPMPDLHFDQASQDPTSPDTFRVELGEAAGTGRPHDMRPDRL